MPATTAPSATLTDAEIREQVALFAATYPTPAVRRAVELASAGRISFRDVYEIAREALIAALARQAEQEASA